MAVLGQTTIRELHDALVTSRLIDAWPTLLAGVSPHLRSSLAVSQSPSATVLTHLFELNDLSDLGADELPLETVVKNAALLARERREEPFFLRVLDEIRAARDTGQLADPSRSPIHVTEDTFAGADRIYVVSDLWDVAAPVSCRLDEPAGLVLERLVQALKLPRSQDFHGRAGLRFTYSLELPGRALDRRRPLAEQGVGSGDTLSLLTTITRYAAVQPVDDGPAEELFRYVRSNDAPLTRSEQEEALKAIFAQAGLVSPS